MHTFRQANNKGRYSVGLYVPDPRGGEGRQRWYEIAETDSSNHAAAMVNYLNGGTGAVMPKLTEWGP